MDESPRQYQDFSQTLRDHTGKVMGPPVSGPDAVQHFLARTVVRFYHDTTILEIGEGTHKVQPMLLARGHGTPVA